MYAQRNVPQYLIVIAESLESIKATKGKTFFGPRACICELSTSHKELLQSQFGCLSMLLATKGFRNLSNIIPDPTVIQWVFITSHQSRIKHIAGWLHRVVQELPPFEYKTLCLFAFRFGKSLMLTNVLLDQKHLVVQQTIISGRFCVSFPDHTRQWLQECSRT